MCRDKRKAFHDEYCYAVGNDSCLVKKASCHLDIARGKREQRIEKVENVNTIEKVHVWDADMLQSEGQVEAEVLEVDID